ncbi:HTH domain-containing protein [Cerasicoccus maritimus]|uniref:HTH domain-containing protein n=1 Tax=Cerasicoccus maritimus TaxID=490089 RepID=UPI002852571B|nr:HTH domain-containing protein [Cerasicoccus maritimus]
MSRELTWKKAIDKVLSASPEPLHYKEIAERIRSEGLRKNLGATPAATVNTQISSSIKKLGDASPYVRTGRGIFGLTKKVTSRVERDHALSSKEDAEEEQYAVISSFGMFWRREAIEWSSKPKILGMQDTGADSVNFAGQLGIYLLYDGREVIYVGRATERSLGRRLYDHTLDRMAARWDRFSWFGLLPVSEKGTLGTMPESFDSQKLIPALEAILIEALEPRQNRKRGDDLAAVEYIQAENPDFKNRIVAQVMKDKGII